MLLGNASHRLNHGDAADLLPDAAAERLRVLRDRAQEASAASRMMADRIAELRDLGLELDRQLALFQRGGDMRSPAHGYVETPEMAQLDDAARRIARLTWVAPTDLPQVADLKKRRRRAFDELRRLEALAEPKIELAQRRRRLVDGIENFLRREIPAGSILQAIETSPPKIKGRITDAIEDRRRRLREIDADIRAAEIGAAKAKIAAHFATLRDRGPSVERLLFGGDLEMPVRPMTAVPAIQSNPPILIAWHDLDAEALIAYAAPGIEQRLCADVDAALAELKAAGTLPLSDAERARRLTDLRRDRLAVEREEVALLDAAVAQGLAIEYRSDTDPHALLTVTVSPAIGTAAA